MEELMLTQMQIAILKTMIEAYEKGSNVHLTLGMAAGKTTVMKIFNEYVRLKKANPSFRVEFNNNGVKTYCEIIGDNAYESDLPEKVNGYISKISINKP